MDRIPDAPAPVDHLLIWRRSADGGPWWWRLAKRLLIDPGYGHVSLAFFDPDGNAWVLVDPLFGGIQVRTLPPSLTVRQILAYHAGLTAWCVLPGQSRDHHGYTPRGLITCVSVVKAVTGLRGWAITPAQLYRQIVRMAADGNAEQEAQGKRRRQEGSAGGGAPPARGAGAPGCEGEAPR